MNIPDIFSKALDEAFEQGMTIDKAVAFAELRLEDHRKVQAKRRWRIIFGIAAITLILAFMLWQFGPDLRLLVTGDTTPTPTSLGQETPALSNNYQITVRSNNQAANEIEFVTEQEHALVVSSDNIQLPDDAVVTFQWVDSCANVGFSNSRVAVENGEATTTFRPTFPGECKLQVDLTLVDDSNVLKTETFPIKIVSATFPQLTIRAEIRDGSGVVESIEAGKRYFLKLYVANNGEGEAKDAVVTITLPDGVSAAQALGTLSNTIEIGGISVPAKQEVVRDVSLIASFIQDATQEPMTITDYEVKYGGHTQRGEAIRFVARNPQPGDIVFDSDTVTVTQRVTAITVTAMDFSGQPVQYPVSLILAVDPPEAGLINPTNVTTTNQGRATIEFTTRAITVTQATLVVHSSNQLTRTLSLVFVPTVVNTGSGTAQNDFYHRLTNDTRSQIVILPNESVEPGSDEGIPDLVNGRIVYRLAVGTPVQVLGESRVVEDGGVNKVFYRVAIQFWMPKLATSTTQYVNGPDLPSGYLRVLQGEPGKSDDSWLIVAAPIPPDISAPTISFPVPLENTIDVDAPDVIIGRVIDDTASSDWVFIEIEGWLAQDVIGYLGG